MGKILRRIKDFCKRYVFKNKIISIIIGLVVIGILLFVIFGRTNVDNISKVKKLLPNKYYNIECMNETCDYVIAYSGDKLGKTNILIYNAYGKKIASYSEQFSSSDKIIRNIYSITNNYIIFKKVDLSGSTKGYTLATTKAKSKYNSDNVLSGLNDFLISEKADDYYNIITKDGKVLYSNVKNIKTQADGKILSVTIKNEDFILNEKGDPILNGYRIVKQVKDEIRILYPTPTIWNSHCFTVFSDNGQKLYNALNDSEISQIAWEKYGFRTGVTGGKYDVSKIGIGVPKTISSTVSSLKMDTYNKLINYLKNN